MNEKPSKQYKVHEKYNYLWLRLSSGIYYFNKTINGYRYRRSTNETKVEAARIKAEKIEAKIRSSSSTSAFFQEIREKQGITDPSLRVLWDELVAHKGERLSKSTHQKYKSNTKHIFEFWGNKKLSEFNQKNIELWDSWFLKNKSHMVYFNIRKELKTFNIWLKSRGLLKDVFEFNDLDKTVLNRQNKREVHSKTYTRAEVKALLKSDCPICSLPVAIGVTMGARKSEILNLKKSDVFVSDEGVLVIKFWSFKNKQYREVPLSREVKERIKIALDKKGSEFLFPGIKDKQVQMSTQVLDRYFAVLKNKMGLTERKTFHDLRRTFATMTAENGWPPIIACRILDMSLKIYDKVYTKPSQKSLKSFIDSVDVNQYNVESLTLPGESDE